MMRATYGLEQARTQLPRRAAEARAWHTSAITRHREPMAAVVPISFLRAQQAGRIRKGGILALRGTGRDRWPEGAGRTIADMREAWQT